VTKATPWRVFQIADSAFPTGGFAHSAGLEAATHFGQAHTADRLDAHVHALLWSVGNASLPFVAETYDRPDQLWEVDRKADAFLTNHVANRASRTQGRAFVATCARVFDEPVLVSVAAQTRTRAVCAHHAPMFGASLAALAVERHDALAAYLYVTLRGIASAAVRLGIVGPYEAQRLQQRHMSTLDTVADRCSALTSSEAASTAPLFDLFMATHDRLYSRLFQS
jgi:urease accessory protein